MASGKVLIGIGVLILAFLYISNQGIPLTTKTLVTECSSKEDLNDIENFTKQVNAVGNFSVSNLENCNQQNLGIFHKNFNNRPTFKETIQENEQNITIYRWCAKDIFVSTRDQNAVENYFNSLFA